MRLQKIFFLFSILFINISLGQALMHLPRIPLYEISKSSSLLWLNPLKSIFVLPFLSFLTLINAYSLAPMDAACLSNNLAEIQKLLKENKSHYLEYPCGPYEDTPLILCIQYGHYKIAYHLLEEGANINAKNKLGITPLMMAAEKGHISIAKYLITHNVDPFTYDNQHETAWHKAFKAGHHDIAKLIWDYQKIKSSAIMT